MNGDRYRPSRMRGIREKETDLDTLLRRQKNIMYGKSTEGYQNYIKTIPKDQRKPGHPHTPVKNIKCSRRAWDGEIRMWRLLLHAYDPPKCKPVTTVVSGMDYSTVTDHSQQDQGQQLKMSHHQKLLLQQIRINEERIRSNNKRIRKNNALIKTILWQLENFGSQAQIEKLDPQTEMENFDSLNQNVFNLMEVPDKNNNNSSATATVSTVLNEAMDTTTDK